MLRLQGMRQGACDEPRWVFVSFLLLYNVSFIFTIFDEHHLDKPKTQNFQYDFFDRVRLRRRRYKRIRPRIRRRSTIRFASARYASDAARRKFFSQIRNHRRAVFRRNFIINECTEDVLLSVDDGFCFIRGRGADHSNFGQSPINQAHQVLRLARGVVDDEKCSHSGSITQIRPRFSR